MLHGAFAAALFTLLASAADGALGVPDRANREAVLHGEAAARLSPQHA